MSGYVQNPLQITNLIADNLRDRYSSGFSVLKELIQNADDPGASLVSFGVSQGLVGAANPLLRGPALCAVNDGAFRAKDARGIRSCCSVLRFPAQGSTADSGGRCTLLSLDHRR